MRLFPFFSVPLPIDLYAEMNTSFNIKEEQTWRNLVMRAVLIVASVGLIVWAMPHDNRSYYHIEKGKPWKYADFTAPFDFPIYKSDEAIKAEKDSLMHDYEPYYQYNANKENEMVKRFEKDYAEGIPGLGPEYIEMISNRLHSLYQQGIMSSAEYSELRTDTARMIRVVNGKQANSVSIMEVYSAKSAYEQLFHDEALALQRPILQKCNLNDYITPNLIYDKERSEASINDLMSSIALASGVVQKGQKIVGRGEIVTDRIYRAMDSFIKENERLHQDDTQNQFALLGQILYVAIIIICFTIYLSLYRRDYLVKSRKIMMAYALITIFSILTAVFVRNTFIHVYILPYAMVPIFIRVFMDSRTAFMAHATMVMICAVMLVHPFEFVVIESIGGLIAISSLRELSQRSQLFKTAIFIALSMMAVNLAFDWMRTDSLSKIDYSIYNYLIINGIALLFAYPLLYLIEKAFGFTSDITLIELSYTNNQLMRKMSEIAPGTFNHSIQVANLASEIANKIGADSQLVRTGALYHDIGKMTNPIYFTENQTGINPHEMLTEIESAQMIISHVTEGQKMADKYNLPKEIRDLLFTYPGPNPFTREQAILMMADTVEAASRSMTEYTEQAIRELVNRLIDTQMNEGYFKECPITFRDIQYAKTVLIEKLKTIYHTRISYPSEK